MKAAYESFLHTRVSIKLAEGRIDGIVQQVSDNQVFILSAKHGPKIFSFDEILVMEPYSPREERRGDE